MRIETVLVHMDTSPEAEDRLALAASMSRAMAASLVGVAAGQTPAIGAVQRSNALLAEAREIEQLLHVAGERFAQTAANLDLASWRAEFTDPARYLGLNARVADIVVVGPRPKSSGLTPLSIDPEDALIEAGRPVLYAPAGVRDWNCERVLIAWKDGRPARRALYEGLPLLARASEVTVLAIAEDGAPDALEDVVAYLEAHGVSAKAEVHSSRYGAVGEDVLAFAISSRADLILAGAFSHTPGQERVFGGVTQELLRKSPIPVLFAH